MKSPCILEPFIHWTLCELAVFPFSLLMLHCRTVALLMGGRKAPNRLVITPKAPLLAFQKA